MNPILPLTFWQEFLALSTFALLIVCAGMLLLWLLHLPFRNASIVDVGWTLGVTFCALYYCYNGSGILPRRFLLALMVLAWGLRLSIYFFFGRILGHPEEGRYVTLRQSYGASAPWRFLLFFQFQAVSCVVLSLPFLLTALNDRPELHPLEKLAAALFVIALSGVAIADRELARFKANPANSGQVCREGLWAWSRHPNYFFEFLVWLSFGLFALTAPWGFLGLLSPALIYYVVNYVTGIPPTEAQALRSKGDAYRLYQSQVNAFWPGPPKQS